MTNRKESSGKHIHIYTQYICVYKHVYAGIMKISKICFCTIIESINMNYEYLIFKSYLKLFSNFNHQNNPEVHS
jgi:hypothetical protein